MTKGESIDLYNALHKVLNLKGVKFGYAISRNITLLKPEIQACQKAIDMSEEFQEFNKEHVELMNKYEKKDEKGKAVMINGEKQYDDELKEKFEKLKEKHKEAVDAREKQVKEFNELLKTDSDVQVYMLKLENLPEDINAGQMAGISLILEE